MPKVLCKAPDFIRAWGRKIKTCLVQEPIILQDMLYSAFSHTDRKKKPLTNRARGRYWGILARGRRNTDLAALGPYKNDRGPIFPSTARAK